MLTLLKIEADGLTPLEAVPKEEIFVGQWSIALGRTYENSFPNISVGIISAVGRIWGRAVQTDAKVSPVNYGGPLVDVTGRCLGILVPLQPDDTGETAGVDWYDGGIGFAISSGFALLLPVAFAGASVMMAFADFDRDGAAEQRFPVQPGGR